MKVPRSGDSTAEEEFDLAYYRSLDTATRFRMIIDRSVFLLRLAQRHAIDPSSPSLAKRV